MAPLEHRRPRHSCSVIKFKLIFFSPLREYFVRAIYVCYICGIPVKGWNMRLLVKTNKLAALSEYPWNFTLITIQLCSWILPGLIEANFVFFFQFSFGFFCFIWRLNFFFKWKSGYFTMRNDRISVALLSGAERSFVRISESKGN